MRTVMHLVAKPILCGPGDNCLMDYPARATAAPLYISSPSARFSAPFPAAFGTFPPVFSNTPGVPRTVHIVPDISHQALASFPDVPAPARADPYICGAALFGAPVFPAPFP